MATDQIDDSLLNELRIGSVQTPDQPVDPNSIQLPISVGQLGGSAPQSIQQMPTAPKQRPTFMSAFLANLGPSLAHGIAAGASQPTLGGGIVAGFGGGLAGQIEQGRYEQQFGLEQQKAQSEAAFRQSEAESLKPTVPLADSEGNPILDANKQPVKIAPRYIPQYLGYGMRLQGQEAQAGARVQSAQITAQAKMQSEFIRIAAEAGELSRIVPSIDPSTNQPAMQMFNKFGQSMGFVPHSVVPQLMATQSQKISFQTDAQGNINVVPYTESTQRTFAGQAGTPPAGAGAGQAQPIATAESGGQNRLVKGTARTQDQVQAAGRMLPLLDRMKALLDKVTSDSSLGPAASRWRNFWQQGAGVADPDFARLALDMKTLGPTILTQAHVGSRPNQTVLKLFESPTDVSKQDPQNLYAAIDEEKSYVQGIVKSVNRPMPNKLGAKTTTPTDNSKPTRTIVF